jgi:hypothetical protein
MRKSSVGVAVLVTATVGSAALGGVALAGGWGDTAIGGAGKGGTATNNCLNVGVPILSGIGLGGSGTASGASCSATANGTGGSAF